MEATAAELEITEEPTLRAAGGGGGGEGGGGGVMQTMHNNALLLLRVIIQNTLLYTKGFAVTVNSTFSIICLS